MILENPTEEVEVAAMAKMTVERLHQLFEENPEKEMLSWQGACHDCNTELEVTVKPEANGIHIDGGSVYEPSSGKFFLKCEDCFGRDSALRNYQSCEVYSRVVGYLRPVAQWNDAKQEEFKDRKLFDAGVSA